MNSGVNSLILSLELSPQILEHFLVNISEKELIVRRRPDFWSIYEHLLHLLEVQPMMFDRLEKFKNEESPVFVPYFPDENIKNDFKKFSINDALHEVKSWRKNQVDLIKEINAKCYKKEALHEEYKKYDLTILLRHILMHDYWHMYRMEELWLTKDKYL